MVPKDDTMTENTQELTKQNKLFVFEVNLNWISKQKGFLSAKDAPGIIPVAAPGVFGGTEKLWTPEHLFLSSISSCFMTTYLVFAKKFKFDIAGFECAINGQVEIVDGKYQFTQITIFPKIHVENESLREKAELALERTKKYCLISNSIKAEMIYHGEVTAKRQITESCCKFR